MKRTILFILFLFLLATGVLAVPPQQFVPQSESLEIAFPKFDEYKLNDVEDFHFHIYNASGYLQTNDTVDCFIHIYDKQGNHVVEADTMFCENNHVDFEWKFNNTAINKPGYYTYIVWCNNSFQGGFLSAEFEMVYNTTEELKKYETVGVNDSTQGISIMLFLLFVVSGLFYISTKQLIDHPITNMILKRGCLSLGFFIMALNSTMVARIALSGGLDISSVMINLYGLIFGWAGYITMVIIIVKTMFDILKLWRKQAYDKRFN